MDEYEVRFKEYLAQHNLKYTPERRRIFHEIFSARDHFDADELFMRLRAHNRRVSRATVYRTLDLLVKLGLVRKVCLGDRSSLYENVFHWKRHGHFVCVACGKVQEFQLSGIDERLEAICQEHNFRAKNRCIQISGFCSECQTNGVEEKLYQVESAE